jgi:hypothetical protein
MNTESDTPRTDDFEDGCINPVAWADFARQLERELADAMAALRNLTDEIGRHEGANMMHPRLTRAISEANRLTNEKKEQEKSIDT